MDGRHRPDAANHGGCAVSLDRDAIAEGSSRRRARRSLAADIAISGLTPSDRPPPFNASAMRDTLLESQLFGHERGAFTGAQKALRGKFELADAGTLFLDVIADMSPLAQAKIIAGKLDLRGEGFSRESAIRGVGPSCA